MENNTNHNDDLKAIRKIMEESSRFLSLSGLSGVFVGIFALAGAFIAWLLLKSVSIDPVLVFEPAMVDSRTGIVLGIVAVIVLTVALATAYFFALRRSRKDNTILWGPVTKRLLINLLIPLFFGALFIMVLVVNNSPEYIVSAMLCFYGMALLNAGKFTFDELRYLGVLELILGILAGLLPELGLLLWAGGFGVLHIMYGIILHRKYN